MEGELQIVIRVIKANIKKNFEAFGKMDPYARMQIVNADGSKTDIGQTRTDWNAHMSPVWNHTCQAHPYVEGKKVEISVWEDDVVGKDDLIGIASAPVVELLGAISATGEATGSLRDLQLIEKGEVTGKVSVQVLLVRRKVGERNSGDLTRIETSLFESPVVRLGVSGGTAPFFSLKLTNPGPKQRVGHYIGKDLSHATDEITFYEELENERRAMAPVLGFCFEYKGIVSATIADAKPGAAPKDLIVLRNLFDGAKKLRLVDIKIGQKTADAGWQGKTRMAALRQSLVDGMTNSAAEGYRLEGFDGVPPAVTSMDPLLDFSNIKGISDSKKVQKKAFRYMLQSLTGFEMLSFLTDVHQEPEGVSEAKLADTRAPLELAEIVLNEIAKLLVRLAIACRLVTVPQKWIGSSVALAFDAGQTPARSVPEAEVREGVKVQIFDWGRSELNSLEQHEKLSTKDRQDRAKFWCFYVGGIDRLAFEASRLYHNRFCNDNEWTEFLCIVMDYDSNSANDPLGMVAIPVKITPETTLNLHDSSGSQMKSRIAGSPLSTITYSLEWRSYPAGSRLKGAWRFNIVKANNLVGRDKVLLKATSDPYVELLATSKDGKHIFRQQTMIKPRCCDPEYGETLEVPVAASAGQLEATLQKVSPVFTDTRCMVPEADVLEIKKSTASSTKHRAPEKGAFLSDDKALDGWQHMLDSACVNLEALEPYFRGGSDAEEPAVNAATLVASSSSNMLQELRGQRSLHGSSTESLQAEPDIMPAPGGPDFNAKLGEPEDPSKSPAVELLDPVILLSPKPTDAVIDDGDSVVKDDKCNACKCM